jgi:hypothetical protein
LPISYRFDPAANLLETVFSGDIRLDDVAAFIREIETEPWFPSPSLNDVSAVNPTIPTGDVRAIADLLRGFGPRLSGIPFAVVVASPVMFGLVRMIELMIDDVALIKPFRDHESARAWLANPHVES